MEYGYQLSSSVSEDKVAEMGWGGRGGGTEGVRSSRPLTTKGRMLGHVVVTGHSDV